MKKILLIACALFIFSNLQAQTSQIGLKAGINYSDFAGDNAEDKGYESQIGLLGGITAVFGFTDRLGIRTDVLYSEKGSELDIDNMDATNAKFNLKYIDVPILLNIFAGKFSLELGPQVGYLLSAKRNDTKITDSMRKIDLGAVAGVGYMFDNGITAGLRYNLGLAKIYNDDTRNRPGFRNSTFQLTAGYTFTGR